MTDGAVATQNAVQLDAPEQYPEAIFKQREKFIVIGLTGRIGSGCSTAAEFLSKPFDSEEESDFDAPRYNDVNPLGTNERAHAAVYKYAHKHWYPFYVISAREVITTFLFWDDEYKENQKSELNAVDQIACFLQKLLQADDSDCETIKSSLLSIMEEAGVNEKTLIANCSSLKQFHTQKALEWRDGNVNAQQEKKEKLWEFFRTGGPFSKFCKMFKEWLNNTGKTSPWKSRISTRFYQLIGNNIRAYGNPFARFGDSLDYEAYDLIARQINKYIKLYQKQQRGDFAEEAVDGDKPKQEPCMVVIDCFKNIHEANFFRNRYSAFYLVSINVDEPARYERLTRRKNRTAMEIMLADICEYPKLKEDTRKKFCRETDSYRKPDGHTLQAIMFKQYLMDYEYHELFELCTGGRPDWKINANLKSEVREAREAAMPFTNQDVEQCIQQADIHINTSISDLDAIDSTTPGHDFQRLKRSLMRYVVLMMHPGLIPPTRRERCMQTAFTAKLNSGCLSRQVGAVTTDGDFNVLSLGWNEAPKGQLPCVFRSLRNCCGGYDDKSSYSDYERGDTRFDTTLDHEFNKQLQDTYKRMHGDVKKLASKGLETRYCFKDVYRSFTGSDSPVFTRALHAEENAFLSLGAREFKGGILFTTSSPCELCAKKAYELGISRIYYIEPYPGISHHHIFGIGGVHERPKMLLFDGAIGRAYMQLYMPVMPLKDELKMRGFDPRARMKEVVGGTKSKGDGIDESDMEMGKE